MTPLDFGPADEPLHELPHDNLPNGDQADHDAPTFDTGTTIVAVAADEGVVMAADQRASLGGKFTTNKNAEKVSRVHPSAALAISGSVGPAQNLVRSLRAETSLYESRRDERMSMRALSQTAGHLVRGLPVAPILGGVDSEGSHVYELDGGGSVMATDYAAGGSGMQVAYGVLERRFDPGAKLGEATDAAVAAVEAASERDTASGNGVTIATVTAGGVDIEGYDEAGAADGSDAAEEVA
ncbi:proteasome subunit beta [Halosimplex halophilum]|uniref:proteasome subunit beta n=1 Tax=Halosimplex halophilum TaxID=2559572 RepID=UPI00107FA22E|nr:proteasome subunit beta [Halosimplex halophilum]